MTTKTSTGPSVFLKASLGLLITGFLDSIVSFSSAYWVTWVSHERSQHGGYGLWKLWRCHNPPAPANTPTGSGGGQAARLTIKALTLSEQFMREDLGCHMKMADSTFPAWYVASQSLQTVGQTALLASLALVLAMVISPSLRKSLKLMGAASGISYFAGLCITVSLFVFGFMVAEEVDELADDWSLSWSFSLSCIGCLLTQIAASLLATESKRIHTNASASAISRYKPFSEDDDAIGAGGENILPVLMSDAQLTTTTTTDATNIKRLRTI